MFVDEAEIYIRSGKGGDGVVHFRKEKYINRGGPDGGDGGKGGDVILKVNRHLNTLYSFRHNQKFIADEGKRGGSKNQTGRSADSLFIDIPPGTLVIDKDTQQIVCDLTRENEQFIICKGGRGGRGNKRFANSISNEIPCI